jgi:hypothetical protein
LLVLATPGRQDILHLLQRFREASDVAMAEDGEDAWEQWHFLAVDDRELVANKAHQRLRHCEADGLHLSSSMMRHLYCT